MAIDVTAAKQQAVRASKGNMQDLLALLQTLIDDMSAAQATITTLDTGGSTVEADLDIAEDDIDAIEAKLAAMKLAL
jgi:hypothetical protein